VRRKKYLFAFFWIVSDTGGIDIKKIRKNPLQFMTRVFKKRHKQKKKVLSFHLSAMGCKILLVYQHDERIIAATSSYTASRVNKRMGERRIKQH
jgi:hypothetical protein